MSAIGATAASHPASSQTTAQPVIKTGYDLDETTVALSEQSQGSAAVSLSADLSGVGHSTEAGWLTLGIAKALQTATTVDPATGQRELISGAGDQLTSTINTLLTESGFSADEVTAATANLSNELAQGGKVSLASSGSRNLTYSAGPTSIAAISASNTGQVSNAVTIGIDLNTGALNVSLNSKGTFIDQTNWLTQGDTEESYNQGQIAWTNGPEGPRTIHGAANSPLSETESDDSSFDEEGTRQVVDTVDGSQSVLNIKFSLVNGQYSQSRSTIAFDKSQFATAGGQQLLQALPVQSATDQTGAADPSATAVPKQNATTNDALQRLIANLTDPKIFKETDAANLVKQLSTIADGVRAQVKATAEALDKQIAARLAAAKETPETRVQHQETQDLENHAQDAKEIYRSLTGNPVTAQVASVQVGVRQTVSVNGTDEQGNATTIYRRPDGGLGKFIPTRISA